MAAADARTPTAAGRIDFAAVDGDLSAGAIIAAADARSTYVAGRIDRATFNADCSAGATVAAADARSIIAAGRSDLATFDGDCSAAALIAAADTRATPATGCIHFAAVNNNRSTGDTIAAADARASIATGCSDFAAVDGDCSAAAGPAAADAGASLAAGRIDFAAVDGDCSAAATVAAADAGVVGIHILNDQRAHRTAGGLGVDGEAVAIPHFNAAVDGEGAAVGQNQVHIAVDGDTLADGDVALRYIPAAVCTIPLLICTRYFCCIRTAFLLSVLIKVEYISRPRCAEQHGPKRCALAGAGVQTAHRAIRIYVALCAEGNAGALLLRARSDGQLSAFPAVRKDSWQRRCRHAQCRYQCEYFLFHL